MVGVGAVLRRLTPGADPQIVRRVDLSGGAPREVTEGSPRMSGAVSQSDLLEV